LFRIEDPLDAVEGALTDAGKALDYISIGNAIGTFNSNGTGSFACGDGWLIAEVELVQEQAEDDDGGVSLCYALFQVTEGWAGALWDGDVDELKRIAGLEGVALKRSCTLWYGE
jgi:hypothetical protein